MMSKSDCPFCGCIGLKKKIVTETFEYKGKSFDYPNYIIYECPACKEEFVDKQSMKDSGRAIRDFYRQVDGLLISTDIRRIRETKLCLTQDKASELLGGGAKSFARYENSEVIQSKAMDKLLRILDNDPSILTVLTDNVEKQKESIVIPLMMKYRFKQPPAMRTKQEEEDYYTDEAACCG
jgi:HTH-type transcriptional regulator/antitoxin MqsA